MAIKIDPNSVQVYVNGLLYTVDNGYTATESYYLDQPQAADEGWLEALKGSGVTAQYLSGVADLGLGGFGTRRKQVVREGMLVSAKSYMSDALRASFEGQHGFSIKASDTIDIVYNLELHKPVEFVKVTLDVDGSVSHEDVQAIIDGLGDISEDGEDV